MIWHIFKKDLRITWPLVVFVAALRWIVPLLAMFGGFVTGGLQALNILRMMVVAGPLASGFVITAAVHLDAIPGVRQDWLVRPIRRRDLVLAKLLFAALAVQVPILLASMTAFLIGGTSVVSAFNSAAEHSLLQMCVINLPFLALASMTRNFLELVSGGVVLGFIVAVMDVLASTTQSVEPVFRSGLGWILYLIAGAVASLGTLLILRLQYFSRRTLTSWFVSAGITIVFLLAWAVPWRFVFAIQTSVAKNAGSSQVVKLSFDPGAGRFRRPSGALTSEDALAILRRDAAAAGTTGTVPIYLPVRVQDLPPDSAIQMDHAEVRITENGHVNSLEQEPWNARREGGASSSNVVYPAVTIPAPIYERIKDQPVRIEIDYWLTLAEVEISESLPATGGDEQIQNGGRCRTRINEQQTAVQYACSGPPAPCFHSFLEYMPGNQRNPDRFGCGQYASFAGVLMNPLFAARLVPSGVVLPFRDPAGLARFPVDGSKLPESRVVLQLYRVQDHFTRQLVIPDVRLKDWEAEAQGS